MAIGIHNKGLYRKVYHGPNRQPSIIVSSSIGFYNANEFIKHYDFFRIASLGIETEEPAVIFGEYEEQLVSFNWEVSKSITFETPFSAEPIVVVSTEENLYSNISFFVTGTSQTGFDVQLSAEFSGSLRYRAIYWASYPVFVERSPLSASSYYSASAGFEQLTNDSEFVAAYNSLGSAPTNVFFTPVGEMVSLVDSGSFGLTGTSGSLSAPLSGTINFLAVL